MRPPSARNLRNPPSVFLKKDLVIISRWITIDLTTIKDFVNSLWPAVHELVCVIGDYADLTEEELFKIETDAMWLIWRQKEGLKGLREPGKFVAHAILIEIELSFKTNGLESKWKEFGDEMRKFIYLDS